MQRIRKMQSKKCDPLRIHYLLPFHQSNSYSAVLKKLGSDVKDHVFHFAHYRHVAKIWKVSNIMDSVYRGGWEAGGRL